MISPVRNANAAGSATAASTAASAGIQPNLPFSAIRYAAMPKNAA